MPRVLRWSSRTPTESSSRCIHFETVGCVVRRSCEARERLPVSTTRTKARMSSMRSMTAILPRARALRNCVPLADAQLCRHAALE